ncbi:hypothetical protein LINPERPRIM_LOCUS35251 [Linum perenne]
MATISPQKPRSLLMIGRWEEIPSIGKNLMNLF